MWIQNSRWYVFQTKCLDVTRISRSRFKVFWSALSSYFAEGLSNISLMMTDSLIPINTISMYIWQCVLCITVSHVLDTRPCRTWLKGIALPQAFYWQNSEILNDDQNIPKNIIFAFLVYMWVEKKKLKVMLANGNCDHRWQQSFFFLSVFPDMLVMSLKH